MKKTIPSHPLILSILDGFTPVVVHNSSTPHKQPNGSWFPMDIDIDIMKNHPIPSFYPFAKLHGCQQRSKGCRAAQDLTKERHITRHRVTRRHASRVTGEAGRKWGQFRWFHQGIMYQN